MQIRNPEKVAIVSVVMLTLGAGGYRLGARSAKGISDRSQAAVAPIREVRVVGATPATPSARERTRKPDERTVIPVRNKRERAIHKPAPQRHKRNKHGPRTTKIKRSDAS